MDEVAVVYGGLEPIEELPVNLFEDILSSAPEHRGKINEIIRRVNRLVEIKNGELTGRGEYTEPVYPCNVGDE